MMTCCPAIAIPHLTQTEEPFLIDDLLPRHCHSHLVQIEVSFAFRALLLRHCHAILAQIEDLVY